MAQTETDPPAASLIGLPAELRLKIYEHLFAGSSVAATWTGRGHWQKGRWQPQNEILQTCKKFHCEGVSVYRLARMSLRNAEWSVRHKRHEASDLAYYTVGDHMTNLAELTVDALIMDHFETSLWLLDSLKVFTVIQSLVEMGRTEYLSYALGSPPWTQLSHSYQHNNVAHRKEDELNVLTGKIDDALVRTCLLSTRRRQCHQTCNSLRDRGVQVYWVEGYILDYLLNDSIRFVRAGPRLEFVVNYNDECIEARHWYPQYRASKSGQEHVADLWADGGCWTKGSCMLCFEEKAYIVT